MSKRKEGTQGAQVAKRARTEHSTSGAVNGLCAIQRSIHQAAASMRLATLLLSHDKPLQEKWTAVTQLLLDDAARPDGPLIDLSQPVEGKGPLLMTLLDEVYDFLPSEHESDEQTQLKLTAEAALRPAVPPLCALVRGGYDASLTRDGWNALHVLTNTAAPRARDSWSYQLAEALLDRGCNVNARDPDGDTPLLNWCALFDTSDMAPCGPLLLLERGADIDAANSLGTTFAHCLAADGALTLLTQFVETGWLLAADLTQRNKEGETALQIAQRRLEKEPNSPERREVCEWLRVTASLWQSKARPLLHGWLADALLPDLAYVVLSFVDGLERSAT